MAAAKESIESNLLKIKTEVITKDPSLQSSPVWDTLNSIAQTANPEPTVDIDYVFILSARATYLGTPVDNQQIPDTEDDYNRVRLGIDVAKKITALRLKKDVRDVTKRDIKLFGPTIIYNGLKQHNHELFQSMVMNPAMANKYKEYHVFLDKNLLNDYPAEKLKILDLPPQHGNTKGQFICVRDKLKLNNTSVAVVTHAYHFPRVDLMLGKGAPLNPFGDNVICYAMLVDRLLKRPGAPEDIAGELKRIPEYTKKGDLSAKSSETVIYKGVSTATKAATQAKAAATKTLATAVLSAAGNTGATGATAATTNANTRANETHVNIKSNAEKIKTNAESKTKKIVDETLESYWLYKLHVANKVQKLGKAVSLDELDLNKIDRLKKKILTKPLW